MYQLTSTMLPSPEHTNYDPVKVMPGMGPLGGYDVLINGQLSGWAPDFDSAMALCDLEGWL